MCLDGLATKARLEKSHVILPQECCFCNHLLKDSNHLFLKCLFSIDVVGVLHLKLGWVSILPGPYLSSFVDNLLRFRSVCSNGELIKVSITWWFIWFRRNKLFFRRMFLPRNASLSQSQIFLKDWECSSEVADDWGVGPAKGDKSGSVPASIA